MEVGLLVLRAVIGLLFMAHGAQKLFGWFGGHGIVGTGGFFESMGLRPGGLLAMAAGLSELAGGLLIALGLLTPLGTAVLTATMTVAIITVHATHGPWVSEGGYEYNLVLIAALFALTAVGPGDWSLDHALSLDLNGAGWAAGAIAAGFAGGLVALFVGRAAGARGAPAQPSAPA